MKKTIRKASAIAITAATLLGGCSKAPKEDPVVQSPSNSEGPSFIEKALSAQAEPSERFAISKAAKYSKDGSLYVYSYLLEDKKNDRDYIIVCSGNGGITMALLEQAKEAGLKPAQPVAPAAASESMGQLETIPMPEAQTIQQPRMQQTGSGNASRLAGSTEEEEVTAPEEPAVGGM